MFKYISILFVAILLWTESSSAQSNTHELLYSQTSLPGNNLVISDDYGVGHYWNCQVADDFTAIGQWSIDRIIVSGQYSDTYFFADGFNIYFYTNNNNKPDSLLYFAARQQYSTSGSAIFIIDLEHSVELSSGHYWVSVQAILNWNNSPYEDWAWNQIAGNYGIEAKFKNPAGVFGCTTSWNPVSTCWQGRGTDMYFELYGSRLTSVELTSSTPSTFSLEQNFPNPFNPSTKISWQLPVSSHQTLKVFDVLGNEVATLVDEFREPGRYEVEFNAENLASGIYFYKLQANGFVETKKMILLR